MLSSPFVPTVLAFIGVKTSQHVVRTHLLLTELFTTPLALSEHVLSVFYLVPTYLTIIPLTFHTYGLFFTLSRRSNVSTV